jgi:catechol 2,3-dioxygenase-like lactoylglutathione lyase family enzyme
MNFSVVHHISINVADVQQALNFYEEILNFRQIPRPNLGDQQLHLLQVENHAAPVGQHFAFEVADIESARNYLLNKKVEVSTANEMSGVCLQCFFKDPSGNLLELNQRL